MIGLDKSSSRVRVSRFELMVHELPYKLVKLLARLLEMPLPYVYYEE